MEKCVLLFFVSTLFWSYVYSCTTPAGKQSKCVSLYDCPDLLAGFKQKPIPYDISSYIKQSHCGFVDKTPKVCCGPFPEGYLRTQKKKYAGYSNTVSSGVTDGYFAEDSLPAPSNECGIDIGDKIYGGSKTELDEFPWMALLGYKKNMDVSTYQCGGFLINHRYVLTAAHCITGAIVKKFGSLHTVRLGEYNTKTDIDCLDKTCADPPQEIAMATAFVHPGYVDVNGSADDIGIVRLAKRAVYSYYVQPLCLVGRQARMVVGEDMIVSGWGKTLAGPKSDVKRKLSVPLFNHEKCLSKYKRIGVALGKNQLCAGGVFSEDTCTGDSGGPLMKTKPNGAWEAVALVSFGYGCGMDGWPAVYTALGGYLDWISSTMKSSNQ